jgi:hypothetical protein
MERDKRGLIRKYNEVSGKLRGLEKINRVDQAISEARKQRIEHLETLLDPRRWNREMSEVWHKNIPNLFKAFEGLRSVDDAK